MSAPVSQDNAVATCTGEHLEYLGQTAEIKKDNKISCNVTCIPESGKAGFKKDFHEDAHCEQETNNPYFCPVCDTQCVMEVNMVEHFRTHIDQIHADIGTEPNSCKACEKSIDPHDNLRAHFGIQTDKDEYSVCDKQVPKDFKRQLLSQGKTFECQECQKTFRRKAELTRHMLIHTGERPYGCRVCMKLFRHNAHLIRHMRTHSGEKPFECIECGMLFNKQGNRSRHMRIHKREKPFQCTVCKKLFKEEEHLTIHTCEFVLKNSKWASQLAASCSEAE